MTKPKASPAEVSTSGRVRTLTCIGEAEDGYPTVKCVHIDDFEALTKLKDVAVLTVNDYGQSIKVVALSDYQELEAQSWCHVNALLDRDAQIAGLREQLSSTQADRDQLISVLEAVRSQMCWERDRDQLTMGMADLHDSVTEALATRSPKPLEESES